MLLDQVAIAAQAVTVVEFGPMKLTVADTTGYVVGDTVVVSSSNSAACALAGTYYYLSAVTSTKLTLTADLGSGAVSNCQVERPALTRTWYAAESPYGGVTPGTVPTAPTCRYAPYITLSPLKKKSQLLIAY